MTAAGVPDTLDWTQDWGLTESAAGTTFGYETNVFTYDIYERDTLDYMVVGRMSTKKQVKNGVTSYWWGYTQQINFKKALVAGNIL